MTEFGSADAPAQIGDGEALPSDYRNGSDIMAAVLELVSEAQYGQDEMGALLTADALMSSSRVIKIRLLAKKLNDQGNKSGLTQLWITENIRGLHEYEASDDIQPRDMNFPIAEPLWGQVYVEFRRYLQINGDDILFPDIASAKSGEKYSVGRLGGLCLSAAYTKAENGDLINVTYTATKPVLAETG